LSLIDDAAAILRARGLQQSATGLRAPLSLGKVAPPSLTDSSNEAAPLPQRKPPVPLENDMSAPAPQPLHKPFNDKDERDADGREHLLPAYGQGTHWRALGADRNYGDK
jgi:hypothetical protein